MKHINRSMAVAAIAILLTSCGLVEKAREDVLWPAVVDAWTDYVRTLAVLGSQDDDTGAAERVIAAIDNMTATYDRDAASLALAAWPTVSALSLRGVEVWVESESARPGNAGDGAELQAALHRITIESMGEGLQRLVTTREQDTAQ